MKDGDWVDDGVERWLAALGDRNGNFAAPNARAGASGMLILWSFFAVLALVFRYNKVSPFRFDYFTTLIWLVALSVNFIGLVSYPPLNAITIWFVVGCHVALIIGYNLVGVRVGGGYAFVGDIRLRTQILALLALIFVILVIVRAVWERQPPFIGALSGLEEARSELWERGGENANVMDQFVRIFSYGATAYLMLTPLIMRQWWDSPRSRRRRLIPYGLLALVAGSLIVDQAFRDAGRALIVYLILGGGAIYLVLYPPSFKKAVLIASGAVLLTYFLTVTFYQYRNQSLYKAPQAYIELNCAGGRPKAWVVRGSDALPAAAISSCYLTSPVHNLDAFLVNNRGTWDHSYGVYNGSIFTGKSFEEIREDLAWYYRRLGQAQYPWATAARDYWLDWSWWAVLAFLMTGVVFGWLSRKRTLRTETDLARFGLIAISAFFMPFQSPLINRGVVYPIIVTLLVDLLASGVAPGRHGGSARSRNLRRTRGAPAP